MIGVPGDTEESIRNTIDLNKILSPAHLQLSIFQPFPGTPIYERCLKEGLLLEGKATTVFLYQPGLKLPGISMERFHQLFEEFRDLGWLWEAKKGKKGYLDLSGEFEQAKKRIKEVVKVAVADLRSRKIGLEDLAYSVKLFFDPNEKIANMKTTAQPYQCALQLVDSGRKLQRWDTVSFIKSETVQI
jgi:radical SAM superfamily enzyme YgiQ (UPF0313 family)